MKIDDRRKPGGDNKVFPELSYGDVFEFLDSSAVYQKVDSNLARRCSDGAYKYTEGSPPVRDLTDRCTLVIE